jgi:hypothetical protein
MYRKAVVEQGFIYDRFREDFINSHTFHDAADADSRNDHKVNLGRIGSLLSIRDDLVRKYSSTSMGPDEFLTCMREFMLESPRMKPRLINLEGYLSDNALKVVTDAANDIPLFKRDVSQADMDCLFNRCEQSFGDPLVANSNEVLAYFLSRLNYHGIISNKYQTVLGEGRLVIRSSGTCPLSQTDISSALRNFESSDKPIASRVDRWVVLIKSATLGSS